MHRPNGYDGPTMDLFSERADRLGDQEAPLAARMRPRTLEEFVGQSHVLGPHSALRALIEADELRSVILWGPAGTGKTSLAHIIANATRSHFEELSATSAGVKDVRAVLAAARERLGALGRRSILFIDEIHRFNKGQQDALLPGVEDRTVVLVGATTENPFFTVNAPLMSRSLLFRLEPLGTGELETIVTRALADPERGLGGQGLTLDDDALAHLVDRADGDARHALNALEAAALVVTAKPGGSGGPRGGPPERRATRITLADIEDALQRPRVTYDRAGDQHYDVASAFIKSIRGSDPDAALHYLARMLAAGEDPRFIARRLVISASEDVGLADPQALPVAVAAFQALEFVGLPEARLNLAEAVVYLALAPKSNSAYAALGEATRELEEARPGRVPSHLQSASYPGERKLGIGVGYVYPHDHPDHWVAQRYLPEGLRGGYYRPGDQGQEARLAEAWRRRRGQPPDPPAGGDPDGRPDRQERG
jgi:putative ATPase